MTCTTIKRRAATAALAVAMLSAAGCGSDDGSSRATRATAESKGLPVVHMDADHATYAAVGELRDEATDVIVATVSSHVVNAGGEPGVDADGHPLPPIPHTDYTVSIDTVHRSSNALVAGQSAVISLAGGTTDTAQFVLEGGTPLTDGQQALFFLVKEDDGKFYPLAGGSAVGAKQSDGSFTLPPDVTGTDQSLPVSTAQLSATSTGSGTPPAPAPAGGTLPPPGPPPGPPPVSNLFTISSIKTTSTKKAASLKLSIKLPGPGKLRTVAASSYKKKVRKKTKTVKVAVGSASGLATASGTARVTIKLGAKAFTALKRAKRLVIVVKVTYTPTGGTAKTIAKSATLRAK